MYWCVCVGDRELITFLNALAATRAPGCLPRREGPKFSETREKFIELFK